MGSDLPLPIVEKQTVSKVLKCSSARYYFDDLICDRGLTDTIHTQGETVDKFAGVLGSRIHCRHARALFRRDGLQQRSENLSFNQARQQLSKHLSG